MVSIATTGSKILDIINQIIMDRFLDRILEEEIVERVSDRFRDEGYYVIDPMVEVKLKGYVTKEQINKIAVIIEDFANRDEWTIADLRHEVREAGIHTNC